jgi:hypothetical protein
LHTPYCESKIFERMSRFDHRTNSAAAAKVSLPPSRINFPIVRSFFPGTVSTGLMPVAKPLLSKVFDATLLGRSIAGIGARKFSLLREGAP